MILHKLLAIILDFVLPRNCFFCGKFGVDLCIDCDKKYFQRTQWGTCHVCKAKVYKKLLFVHQDCAKLSNIDGVFAAIKYNKAAKEFLQLIKYSGYYTLIDVLIDQCLYSFANLPIAYDYVVPIPLHQSRRRWRGFNQAEVMAAKLTRNYRDILSRVRNTKAQAHLTKEQRLTNAQNAFSVGPSNLNPDLRIKGKTILLIDDVFTTGATSENCALVLKSHGAKKVYLYTWARGDG